MGGHEAIEFAKTVMEVADVARTAVECCHGDDKLYKSHAVLKLATRGVHTTSKIVLKAL